MGHLFSHLRTITRHHNEVFRLCRRAGIGWRGFWHDFSKLSPVELSEGARFWTGTHSPNVEARGEYGYSAAWMHHMGRNRHHFEYWKDYVPGSEGLTPIAMPPVFFCEMVCDRIAACKIYLGAEYTDSSPLAYYERKKHTYFMHPDTSAQLEHVLTLLAERGEEALFEYLRVFAKQDARGGHR